MTQKQHFRIILADVRKLLEQGSFDQARAILDGLKANPDISALGPNTVIGMPRPLHAVYLKMAKSMDDVLGRVGYQFTLVPPPELLAKYGRISSAERAKTAEADRQIVPKVIHQIWIGPKLPPVTTSAWQSHARNHGYAYKLWREDDLHNIGVYDNSTFANMLERGDYPGAVDVARYEVLHRDGGIYLDCDWYPARTDVSFHDRLALVGLTVIAEEVPRDTGFGGLLLSNAFIAAPAGHPALKRILNALPQVIQDMPDAPAWWSTGPLLFTVICRGGTVAVADGALVEGKAPNDASLRDIKALCVQAGQADGGLLLAWKPW
ncbi:MAG: glycosyltransferase [Albidovulum sp.]